MKYAIVTGVSRGLGLSIATHLLTNKIHVIGLSRQKNATLEAIAEEHQVDYTHYSCDLADIQAIDKTCEEISTYLFTQDVQLLYLIQNAGVLHPSKPVMDQTSAEIAPHMPITTMA